MVIILYKQKKPIFFCEAFPKRQYGDIINLEGRRHIVNCEH